MLAKGIRTRGALILAGVAAWWPAAARFTFGRLYLGSDDPVVASPS